MIGLYTREGYTVDLIMKDQEFEKLKEKLGLIEVNTTAAREHVGKIESSNQTVQERSRAICSLLPYSILPKQVVIHMIYFVVTFLNCDVTKLGILDVFSPRELVLRRKLDWIKHCTSKANRSNLVNMWRRMRTLI